jgi:hypothetical protein
MRLLGKVISQSRFGHDHVPCGWTLAAHLALSLHTARTMSEECTQPIQVRTDCRTRAIFNAQREHALGVVFALCDTAAVWQYCLSGTNKALLLGKPQYPNTPPPALTAWLTNNLSGFWHQTILGQCIALSSLARPERLGPVSCCGSSSCQEGASSDPPQPSRSPHAVAA